MKYVYFCLCAAVILWMAWLCIRSFTTRIPEQRRVYCTIHPTLLIFYLLMFSGLLGLGCVFAAAGGTGPWIGALVLLAFVIFFAWLLGEAVCANVAFSEEVMAVRDLFGPVRTYRWAEVTAYTMHKESVRGRFAHDYDLYELTLADRVIRISGAEDAGRELLQVFERRRPDMKAMRETDFDKMLAK